MIDELATSIQIRLGMYFSKVGGSVSVLGYIKAKYDHKILKKVPEK